MGVSLSTMRGIALTYPLWRPSMEAAHVDSLTKQLTDPRSRRGLLAGALLAALGMAGGKESDARKKTRKKKSCPPCKKRKQGKCKGNKPDGVACTGGTCQGGTCIAAASPPPPPPPPFATPACLGRVCGPNIFGEGSCGDCGSCKTCEGGACFSKVNGTACGGVCEECQSGACVPKANGIDCGGNFTCQGGECVCAPSNRICGDICCPTGNICVDPDAEECVDAQGTCAAGANFCVDGASKCGLGNCFCYQTFGGETRCGNQALSSGTCTCTTDAACTSFGLGAFCAKDAGTGFCAGCPAAVGFCATRCLS